jgi:ABC-type branched-subunit amino acid transport system ATPase component
MLEVRDVRLWHGPTLAVDGVSLDLPAGELLALVGSNGAGKSSLARAIAGTHRPIEGHVRLAGEDISRLGPAEIAARGLTHLPEGRPLALTLSVRDNLLSGGHVLGALSRAQDRLAQILPSFPELAARLDQPAADLSGGERQWLVVARALMAQPNVMVIDEPTLGLGPRAARQTLETIAGLRNEGAAILLIEQNAAMALAIADRAAVMVRGRIVAADSADALRNDAALARGYLGAGSRG